MKVNNISNQNFQGFNYSKAGYAFTERLKSPGRYHKFDTLEVSQYNNPFEIQISVGEKNNLIAAITDEQGNVIFEKKENVLCGLLNLSPIKFLKDLCKQADSLYRAK